MTGRSEYPFSDLSQTDVEQLLRAARIERGRAIRSFIARLFRVRRQRDTQAWPAANEPALSLRTYP
jgi:hypothetical protein